MTGAEHFREAEELLGHEPRLGFGTGGYVNIARGIGHALLALAAAVTPPEDQAERGQ